MIENLKKKNLKIAVIGDCGINIVKSGRCSGLCETAPVPVFSENISATYPAGAGEVACFIKAMGSTPILIGYCGEDQQRLDLEESLSESGVDCSGLLSHNQRHTTRNEYFVVNGQLMFVSLTETRDLLTKAFSNLLISKLGQCDGIIVTKMGYSRINVIEGLKRFDSERIINADWYHPAQLALFARLRLDGYTDFQTREMVSGMIEVPVWLGGSFDRRIAWRAKNS